ncbi:uncharacterized protein GGS22DRAFT_136561 [Annulohypoxylon maeteangense]|uniref:uncharacterized protein n=1 Tax=Annulohypoxylon maeteangense TaxID=1927788 RepID=UPI0020088BA3|nr:uncharacterized protein GGS22DRAFT_136561 [Annulohypoxylon maeteangense]KAI0884965.1 hypothetical protein GGS22DRAFT_136561 [Annulohypoxylon maeteangense]
MVSRKPLPDNTSVNTSTPPPAVSIQAVRQELWSATDSESDSERVWGRDNSSSAPVQYGGGDIGNTKVAGSDNTLQDVPDTLRPGTISKTPSFHQDQNEENPWDDRNGNNRIETGPVTEPEPEPEPKSDEMPKSLWPGGTRFETNPFKRKPIQAASTSQVNQDNQESPAAPTIPPPPPPVPIDPFAQLHISEPETSTNPWQPTPVEPRTSNSPHPAPPLPDQETKGNVWDSGLSSRVPSTAPVSNSPSLVPLHADGESQPWRNPPSGPSHQQSLDRSREAEDIFNDQHAWDDIGSNNKGKQPATQPIQTQSETVDGWNLIDHEPIPEPVPGTLSKQSTWENFMDADDEAPKEAAAPTTVEVPPSLPPRRPSNENPPQQPPRPQPPSATGKSETYQIKNINWFDPRAAKNPRKSPILVQNANGPCPLVALVNALTLTTLANQPDTNLVETLRSREQISLNFLLEAVVDELVTHRYTNLNASLPDMSELYSFLKGLHTGMNVNPQYIPSSESMAAYKQACPTYNPPSEDLIPGTFENTRDMKLYATFLIPLIHGWLPPKEDPAYDAFTRQATSYDDVQSILFREEELEDKLSNSEMGLTEQEQQLYQDIIIIKSFLMTSATQLTPWGLGVITKAVLPGHVSILFRNDHFSTLYRHPQTLKLFSLVTDAGYYTHDEVVWESLVDVRGERTEFFSGDFRLVGGAQHQRSSASNSSPWHSEAGSSSNAHGGEWQTVQGRRPRNNNPNSEPNPSSPVAPKHEQEDRDLALALQLQEEEEERHRAEQAARRRESQLSEQFIEQQGRQGTPSRGGHGRGGSVSRGGGGPQPPARGSSANQSTSTLASRGRSAQTPQPQPQQQVRSLIPPASTTHRPINDSADDAPPSYEQASKATPYVPPAGHPSHPESSPSSSTPRRRPTLPGPSSAGPSTSGRGRQGAGPPVPAGTAQVGGGREKDCIVM